MDTLEDQIEVIAGQLVAQGMLVQILLSQLVLVSKDNGAVLQQALADGIEVMQRNPHLTTREKFGAVRTIEDALDTLEQVRAAMPGR
ncbi:MAG: hypothetical protein NXI18_17975 [Alphaproteobacteria bacterium]|jgi:hypothetical protein|nr:hypothetical protein [Alphaproteobacteria bacterium]